MGEHDDALREIADARARMSVLADELGRRANPELLKARAKDFALEKKEEVTEHAKQLAAEKREELKQQAREKVLDWKSHAKEKAMRKTYEWTDEATHTPRGLGLLGALLGAGVGSMLMKRAFRSRIEEREYRVRERIPLYEAEREYYGAPDSGRVIPVAGYNTRDESTGDEGTHLKDRVSSAADSVRGRVHDAADTVRSQASHLRERVPSPQAIRGRTSQWYDRALEEQPLALALGAVALGMLTASLLPVTDKERQLLEPAKRRAQEGLAQLGDQVSQKLEGSEEEDTSRAGTVSMGASGGIPPLPPLEQIAPKMH
ncbi:MULTISPECIES: hypothetical protein [unclassified Corallococcus]|uniref:hypothetical protein n=1 Tax=unclassified Corallococcus TaxID=2685029 RepID=UPI001A904AC1|nr:MULTISPECIES: hypothetical protein [unclassified Corallococcus]MBN9682617.1 hypothetical protein [Corallococcus sp. NCSPR001]WAS85838.1 hypothetical protein O0N60_02425 [Corallococcus sp. NCRR]